MIFKFFITPVYPYGNDHYYHEIIALAEGLESLGYTFYGNCNYWLNPFTNEYLIKESNHENYDIAIYDYRYIKSFEHLLFSPGYRKFDKNKKHILIDRNDDINPVWLNVHYRIFDLVCSGNLFSNMKHTYPKNVRPWSIGLTNRIMEYIDNSKDLKVTDHIVGHNFRVPHNMRSLVMNSLQEINSPYKIELKLTDSLSDTTIEASKEDLFYWEKSTHRHNPAYYKLLNQTLAFSAFGGYYEYKPISYRPYSFIEKILRKPNHLIVQYKLKNDRDITPQIFVFQYDSFRMWEVLYSNSCPILLSPDFWNFWLPEKPENLEHFLGITSFNCLSLQAYLQKLSTDEITAIGLNGKKWVTQHYSPRAQAKRLISYLNDIE